jgi:hypothetical protein
MQGHELQLLSSREMIAAAASQDRRGSDGKFVHRAFTGEFTGAFRVPRAQRRR